MRGGRRQREGGRWLRSVEARGRGLAAHVARVRSSGAAPPAPEAAPAEAAGPVIDQAIYDALCEAIGAETMAELLEKVIADLISAQRDLASALGELDRAPIRSASHILISVAGAIGAVRLQHCAQDLNAVAHTDAADRIAATTRACIYEIDAAVAFARDRHAAR